MRGSKEDERKERTLVLKLSDADAKQLYIKAGMSGIRVTELLEHFIQDLTYSINSNGSDERDLANQWFDRCMFQDYGSGFVQFALESGNGKWAADRWQSLLEARTRLNKGISDFCDQDSDFCDQEEMDAVRDDAAFWQEELQEYYQEYVEHGQAGGEGMEAEMQKLSKWYQELDTFIERGSL